MPKRPDIRARSAALRSRHTTLRLQGPDLAEAKASLASDMMKMSQRQAVAVYMLPPPMTLETATSSRS